MSQQSPSISSDLRMLLDSEAARINSPAFIGADPVQFPRRYTDLRDIEITALLCSSIAWGNRRMICRDCDRMLALMGHDPYHYVMDRGYEDLEDFNVHRTFFTRNLRHFLRGLHRIYAAHGSLQDFARSRAVGEAELPAWALAEAVNAQLREANGGADDSRCLPINLEATALKRLNMALRWLVRDDGIVDMGVWDVIRPSQLFIPLDVHVGNTARDLGLITRRSNDRRTVLDLTRTLAALRPDDPAWYDYALFGIGIGDKATAGETSDGEIAL